MKASAQNQVGGKTAIIAVSCRLTTWQTVIEAVIGLMGGKAAELLHEEEEEEKEDKDKQ